jgi:hypothetical protein
MRLDLCIIVHVSSFKTFMHVSVGPAPAPSVRKESRKVPARGLTPRGRIYRPRPPSMRWSRGRVDTSPCWPSRVRCSDVQRALYHYFTAFLLSYDYFVVHAPLKYYYLHFIPTLSDVVPLLHPLIRPYAKDFYFFPEATDGAPLRRSIACTN